MPAAELDLARFDRIVGLIYDAADDPTQWREALQEMSAAFGSSCTIGIFRPDSAGENGLSLVLQDGFYEVNDLLAHQRAAPFPQLGGREVASLVEMMSEEGWQGSAFYRELCAPAGIVDILCIELRLEDRSAYRFRFARNQGSPVFGEAERGLAGLLLPHLRRALRLHQRLARSSVISRRHMEACDRLGVATFILDSEGKVLESNGYAHQVLARPDGLALREDRLTARDSSDNRELQRALRAALEPCAAGDRDAARALSLHRGSSTGLHVLVQRVEDAESLRAGRRRPAAMLFVRDPDFRVDDSARAVRALYDLTQSESALLMRLANGLSLPEAAEDMNIRHSTARTHLRAIYAKTGVSRQSLLVRQVLNSVTMLMSDAGSGGAVERH